ncbi:M16 family metallopeptidase [Peterkaempfera bronchialis]|uniref:M16 family metallopeptidase n=1 Tax=Peterkaempfera bronchialis TaxID=2126346 RepID=UPI003C2BE8FD
MTTPTLPAHLLPDLRQAPPPPPLDHAARTLPSGLRIVAARRASVPMVELRLGVPFGGEEPRHCADAELLVSTLLCGTARRDRDAFERDLAGLGGTLRATVRPERLKITARAPVEGLPLLLDLLADCLTGAAYDPRAVEAERARLVDRVRIAERLPQYAARAALLRHCFGDHPAARETPSADQVAAVPREALPELHRTRLVPGGSVLVLAGDLTPGHALDAAATALADWSGAAPARAMPRPPAVLGGPVATVDRPGVRQADVWLAGPSLPRQDPEYPALHLAEQIVGGYFSSRLMRTLREEAGYVYSARCAAEEIGGQAVNLVQFGCDPRHAAEALDRTLAHLDRIGGDQPPTPEEVRSAAGYSRGVRSITLSSQTGLADALFDACVHGLAPDWLTEFPARLAATGTAEVRAAAARHLSAAAFTGVLLQP